VANGEVGNHRRAPCAPHCTPLRPTNKVCSPLLPTAAYLCSSDEANHSGSRPGYSVSAADTGGSVIPESPTTGQKRLSHSAGVEAALPGGGLWGDRAEQSGDPSPRSAGARAE